MRTTIILALLTLAGCVIPGYSGCSQGAGTGSAESTPVPSGCAPAVWDAPRGCVETGEGDGVKERITLPECCGRLKGGG